jgi:formamidase
VPQFEGGAQFKTIAPSQFYATVGLPLKGAGEVPVYVTYIDGEKIGPLTNLSEDLTLAARNALIEMIDYLVRQHKLTPEQAYVVASVAVDLRVSQVVDVPNFIVSAFLPLEIFTEGD